MAWPAGGPRTWSRGETPTHTQLIADLIDAPLSLRSLNDVSAGVYRNANQSIPDSSRTAISWTHSLWQRGGVWAIGAPTRLVAPIPGAYLFGCTAPWTPNNSGRRGVGYSKNTVAPDFDLQFNAAQSGASRENGAELIWLEGGDWIEAFGYQSSGGALNLLGGNQSHAFASLSLRGTESTAPIWTAPRTWANGDIFTPWRLNTHWRDNLLNLRALNGQAVKLSLAENLSVANNQRSPIPWDVEQFQIGTMWVSGSQITALIPGWYMLLATLEWRNEPVASVGVIRGVGYRINNRSPDHDRQFQGGAQAGVSTNGKALFWLNAGDTVDVYAYHDSDQSLILNGGLDRTRCSLHLEAA